MNKKTALIIAVCILALACFPLIALGANVPPLTLRIVNSTGSPIASAQVTIRPTSVLQTVTYSTATDANGLVTFPQLPLECLNISITEQSGTLLATGDVCFFLANKTEILGYTQNHYEININKGASSVGAVIMAASDGKLAIPTVADNATPVSPTAMPTATASQNVNLYDIKAYLMTTQGVAMPGYSATVDNLITAQANDEGAAYIPDINADAHTLKVYDSQGELVGGLNFEFVKNDVTRLYGKDEEGTYEIQVKNGIANVYMYVQVDLEAKTIAITKASEQALAPGTKPKPEETQDAVVTKPNVKGYFTKSNGQPVYPATLNLTNADDLSSVSTTIKENGSYEIAALNMGSNTLITKETDGKTSLIEFMAQAGDSTSLSVKDNKPLITVKRGAAEVYLSFINDGNQGIMFTGASDSPLSPPSYEKPSPTLEPSEVEDKRVFTLNGKLTDASGKPIADATVKFGEKENTTGANGIFILPTLGLQPYTVEVLNKENQTIAKGMQSFAESNKAGIWNDGNAAGLPIGATSVYVTYVINDESITAKSAGESDFINEHPQSNNFFILWAIIAIAIVTAIFGVVIVAKNKN